MAKNEELPENIGRKIFIGIVIFGAVVIGLIVLFGSFYTIQSGQQGILLTWGRAEPGSIGPGLHFKIPIAQDIVKFNTRTQTLGADASQGSFDSAASKDLQIVKVQVQVNYHLIEGKVPDIYTAVGPSYESLVMVPTLHDALKAVTARYTAEELITKREEVRAGVQTLLAEKMKAYNIVIEQVNIVKFDFSDQFNNAIEAKVTAEQNALTEQNKLKTIEFQAQQKVATANGNRDAQIAEAEGQAQTIKLTAEAEAEKIRLQNQELVKSPQYVELIKAQRWDGKLPITFSGGGVQPFLNVAPFVFSNSTG